MLIIWTMACALAPNWAAFLVFRLLSGIFAASANAIVAGVFADVYSDPGTRGNAMSWFCAVRASSQTPTLSQTPLLFSLYKP